VEVQLNLGSDIGREDSDLLLTSVRDELDIDLSLTPLPAQKGAKSFPYDIASFYIAALGGLISAISLWISLRKHQQDREHQYSLHVNIGNIAVSKGNLSKGELRDELRILKQKEYITQESVLVEITNDKIRLSSVER